MSHASLAKLANTDSTIREALRKNPVLTRTNIREVERKSGIDLPDGHHLPQGAWVAVPAVSIQHDERFYTNSNGYDPFRFVTSRNKESSSALSGDTKDGNNGQESRKPQGLTTTSNIFLPFGHGRHSW